MKRLRILSWNMGYMTEIEGYSDYFKKSGRYLLGSGEGKARLATVLEKLISKEMPDLVFLMEVHKTPELERLAAQFPLSSIDCKYAPGDFMEKLTFTRKNSNGFFAKEKYAWKKRYLSSGTKKLVFEINLGGGAGIFLGHFSLRKHVRAQQFEEIGIWSKTYQYPLVMGDLNVSRDPKELLPLEKRGLRLVNDPAIHTFPTNAPSRTIDLLLASTALLSAAVRVLADIRGSDHLPILAEIETTQ